MARTVEFSDYFGVVQERDGRLRVMPIRAPKSKCAKHEVKRRCQAHGETFVALKRSAEDAQQAIETHSAAQAARRN